MIIKLENGDIHYINKLDDFKEVVEPAIYEAIEEFVNNSNEIIQENLEDEKYDEIGELENDLSESEDIKDEYYSILNTVSDKIRDLTSYLEENINSEESNVIIEKLSKELDYLNYDLLSEF